MFGVVSVVLCYLRGTSHEEAASTLGWPVGTVKSRLTQARDLPAPPFDAARPLSPRCLPNWKVGAASSGLYLGGTCQKHGGGVNLARLRAGLLLGLALLLLGTGGGWLYSWERFHDFAEPSSPLAREAKSDLPAVSDRRDLHGDLLSNGAIVRLGTACLRQHNLACAEFSADGRSLATGDANGTVCLWDVESGKQLHKWLAHDSHVGGLGLLGQRAAGDPAPQAVPTAEPKLLSPESKQWLDRFGDPLPFGAVARMRSDAAPVLWHLFGDVFAGWQDAGHGH